MILSSLSIAFIPRSVRYTQKRYFTKLFGQQKVRQTIADQLTGKMDKKVIILGGVTSVGKSAVSLELCKYLNAEIVVADSVQVYKGFDIGANKPTAEEQQLVPHHMIDICDPCVNYNTAEFSRKAADIIHDIIGRNKTPIVVGGSTMWIQWLTQGIPDAPPANQETVQKVKSLIDGFEAAGEWEKAIEILQQYDPSRVEKFHTNDWYRLKRNLEICIDQQITPSTHSSKPTLTGERKPLLSPELDIRCFFLTEDREDLYNTIDTRCIQMLLDGLIREVADLLHHDQLSLEFPNYKSIGYRQTIEYLCNETLPEKQLEPFVQYLT
jgi:tRNA dimethylallyltransferase